MPVIQQICRAGRRTLVRFLLAMVFSGCLAAARAQQQPDPEPTVTEAEGQVNRRGIIPVESPDSPKRSATNSAELICSDNSRKDPEATDAPCPAPKEALPPSFGPTEEEISRKAWNYFLATRNSSTGLFDSIRGYHAATMWDIGSAIAGLVSARQLNQVSEEVFNRDIREILAAMQHLPLYNNELPNREYDVRRSEMLDGQSRHSSRGSGWSAIDIGRLLIWLKITEQWYPELATPIHKVVSRWRFDRLKRNGQSNGVLLGGSGEQFRQEGRLGYEQYVARGYSLWGIQLSQAQGYEYTAPFRLLEVPLRRDKRNLAYLTSEPFVLATMEIGSVDPVFDELVRNVFEVQEKRWQETGILTALSEDAIDQEPWFLYNTIAFGEDPWVCVSPGGHLYPGSKSMSTKAALAWSAIYDDSYSRLLREKVLDLNDERYGYIAGVYEGGGANESFNINTNAVILEAMLYQKLGRRPFLAVTSQDLKLSGLGPAVTQ